MNDDVTFPRQRFAEAGATPDELDALEAQHASFSTAGQASQVSKFRSMARADLSEHLTNWRELQKPADDGELDAETEPADADTSLIDAIQTASTQGAGGRK